MLREEREWAVGSGLFGECWVLSAEGRKRVGSGLLAVWLGVRGYWGGIFFGWVCKERGFLNSFSSGFLSIFSAGFLLLYCNNRSAIGNSASFSEIIRYLV